MTASIIHQTGTFSGANGTSLFFQRWLPEGKPVAAILLVHGFGEHSDRYVPLATALVAAGYGVHTYDTRGHGRSAGQRGHIGHWSEYREDLLRYQQLVADAFPGQPLFLYGHSLGALMVLDYLLEAGPDVAGAVISGAPIEPAGVAKPWLVALARISSRLLPRMPAPVPIRPADLSHDPAVIAALATDPLIHRRASARWGTETLATIEKVKAKGAQLHLPLLFLHGAADPINTAAGATRFAHAIPNGAAEIRLYPDALHEPHNDLCRDAVVHDVLSWLKRQSLRVSTLAEKT